MTRLLRLVLLSALCALPCLAQEEGLPPPTGLRRVMRTHGPAWRIVRTEQDAQGRRSALVLVRVMRTHGPGYRWVRVPARQERPDPAVTRLQEEAAARLGPQAVERIQQELLELNEELREWSGLSPEEQARRLEECARAARAALENASGTPVGPAPAGDLATPVPAGDQAAPAPPAPPTNGLIDQLEPGAEKEGAPPPRARRPRRVS